MFSIYKLYIFIKCILFSTLIFTYFFGYFLSIFIDYDITVLPIFLPLSPPPALYLPTLQHFPHLAHVHGLYM